MANEPNAQAGCQEGQQSGENAAKSTTPTSQPTDPAKQYVTPEILKGVLDRQLKTYKEESQKSFNPLAEDLKSLKEQLKTLQDGISNAAPPKESHGKSQPQSEPPELVDLRKRVKELEDGISKARLEAERARQQELDYRFKTQVKDALMRHGCRKPEEAFRIIAPDLHWKEDGKGIFSTVPSEFGTRDLDLEEYVKSVVSEERIPELFEGKMKTGAPASGNAGVDGGKFLFTMEQISDPTFYAQHADQIRQALEQKRVKFSSEK